MYRQALELRINGMAYSIATILSAPQLGFISMQVYFSQIPTCKWASFKRLLAQLHGFLTPGRISADCPHCLRRFLHARTVTGQESHCPHWRSLPHQEPPNDDRTLFSLLAIKRIMAQFLSWLSLIAQPMGLCLKEVYSVVKDLHKSLHGRGSPCMGNHIRL